LAPIQGGIPLSARSAGDESRSLAYGQGAAPGWLRRGVFRNIWEQEIELGRKVAAKAERRRGVRPAQILLEWNFIMDATQGLDAVPMLARPVTAATLIHSHFISPHWRAALALDLYKDAAEGAHQLVGRLAQPVQLVVSGFGNRGFQRVRHDRDLFDHSVA
jgi:hypothetical protein